MGDLGECGARVGRLARLTRAARVVAGLGVGVSLVLALGACGGSGGGADGGGGDGGLAAGRTVVTFAPAAGQSSDSAGLERTAELIRDRAEVAGLDGVEVTVEDAGRITVVGPEGRRASLESLGEAAELGFRPVLSQVVLAKGDAAGESECRAAVDAEVSEPVTACGELESTRYSYRLEAVAVPGSDVSSAEAVFDSERGMGWFVKLEFTSAGAGRFADVTGRLAMQVSPKNQFAIVLDGVVVSAPYVASAITGGEAEISGSFTREEAEQLAAQLSTGALPVRLTVSDVARLPGG
ncbi:SecDF P1 head subdomain-containing protein [Streptomyces sp. NPDC002643]